MSRSILLLIAILLAQYPVIGSAENGRDDTKLTKNITRSFPMSNDGELDIVNKYGQVIINTWDEDSVKISVDIIAYGKNSAAVEKLIRRADVDFLKGSDYLSVETEMNRKGGSLSSLLTDIEGYSKNILNKNKLTVNYTVHVPEGVDLNLENKFGDVFLGDDFEGEFDLELSHGDLKTRRINGKTNITLSYGKGRIKFMKEGFVKLKGGELDIDEGKKVSVESSSSELTYGDIKSLTINSRNDRIRAGNLGLIKGSGDFTDVFITSVANDLDLNLEYGELFVERIGEDFSSIVLNSKSADINLVLNPKSYFTANISGNEDRMIIPNSMLSLGKRDNSGTGYDFTLSGTVGYTREQVGKVAIKVTSADLIISIKETPIFTKNK